MKRKKISILLTLLFIAGSLNVYPGVPKLLYPSSAEQKQMLNEADDFIDEMVDGQQDRQADAIYHAMRGVNGELAALRKSRNKANLTSECVERIEIDGDGSARGIKMRLYKPKINKKEKLPLLVYFHGGGWTIGGIESCAQFCDALASTGTMIVLAVDYRLAPENPFPAGFNDCESSLEYALIHAEELGSASDLVSVGGDSAGGNLALAATMALSQREELSGKLRSMVLIYPVVKAYNDKSASWKKFSRGYGLDGRLMEAFNEAYLFGYSDNTTSKNPNISPAHASDADLKNLPPILIISAERDILYDQGKEFALRLSKLGKEAEHINFPGAVHTFATVKGQPTAFKKAVAITSAFLRK